MNRKLSMMILATLMALSITACACGGGSGSGNGGSGGNSGSGSGGSGGGSASGMSPSPSASATPLPSPVQTPEMSPNPSEGAPSHSADGESTATPEGADGPTMMGIDVSKLITELEKLSEVDTAEIVAHGGRAVVGLNFDAQYQGTLTERIEEMVVSSVTSVEEMLTDIAVTADPALLTEIRTLASETEGKTMTEDQIKQFDELYQKIKPDKSTGSESAAQ